MDDFRGRVAVVTGAAAGMGRAFCERFAREGMRVVLAEIDPQALARAVEEMRSAGHDVLGVESDVTSAASTEALAERAFAHYGKVHVLCNNAGGGGASRGPIWELTAEQWQSTFALNTFGAIHGIVAFVPRMIAMDEEAHIVTTGSMSGLLPGGGPYGAAKAAVNSVTETLYLQLQRRNLKVHAHALNPWFVNTGVKAREGMTQESIDRQRAAMEGGITPDDVAEAVITALRDNRFYILPQHDLDALILERTRAIVAEGAPTALTPWEASERARAAREQR